ncbi:hypothetical protein IWQ61_005090, partial [Dispira simplex]
MVNSFRFLLHGAVALLASGFFTATEFGQANAQPVDNPQPNLLTDAGYSQSDTQSLNPQSKVIVGYYPAWANPVMNPADIPTRLTHINFAFAKINGQTYELKLDNPELFTKVRDHVRKSGTKILICVGGWTESTFFSPMITKNNRGKFIDSALHMIKALNADGIDFNWEFPDRPGRDGNIVDKTMDLPNYMEFIKAMFEGMSKKFGANQKLLTVTTPQTAYGSTGPLETVKVNQEFQKSVNYINVMAYDLNGNWGDRTGPNAPLEAPTGDKNSGIIPGSVDRAVSTWLTSGMPANKIVVGLAFYGRSTYAKVDMRSGGNIYVERDVDRNVTSCTQGDNDGICDWAYIRKHFLDIDFSRAKSGSGWIRNWDKLSQTPWLYQPSTKWFLSYDDPESISIKANEVEKRKLAGVMIWDISKDYNGELMKAINFQGGGFARRASLTDDTQ